MIFSPDLRNVVDDVLGKNDQILDAEGSASAGSALWATISELGWPLVGVPESSGGSGGDLADAAELAAGIGRYAVPLPLIETGAAAWALAAAGLPLDAVAGGAALAAVEAGALPAMVSEVRWLPVVPALVVARAAGTAGRVTLFDTAGLTVERTENLAEEPLGAASLAGVTASAVVSVPAALVGEIAARVAVLRAAALVGALERVCRMTTEYVSTRKQFGRPLAAQQAVGHLIADLALERDLAGAAVRTAVLRPGPGTAAAARASAARAAGVVATGAHQLHGAMGITREYPLHRYSRRLWAWRDEEGTQRSWEQALGEQVLGDGTDEQLWSLVTGSPAR